MRSFTWDRGIEMAQHEQITLATNADIYFCDLQSSWRRVKNENTNRLLRQYYKKKTDLSVHARRALDLVAYDSIHAQEKRLASRPQQMDWPRCCDDRLNAPSPF